MSKSRYRGAELDPSKGAPWAVRCGRRTSSVNIGVLSSNLEAASRPDIERAHHRSGKSLGFGHETSAAARRREDILKLVFESAVTSTCISSSRCRSRDVRLSVFNTKHAIMIFARDGRRAHAASLPDTRYSLQRHGHVQHAYLYDRLTHDRCDSNRTSCDLRCMCGTFTFTHLPRGAEDIAEQRSSAHGPTWASPSD